MADFQPGGVQKFFSDFAPALMRHAKGVLYLVIEESHEIAIKEQSGIGNENMSIHWAKKLATAGRSKGIRLIVATQCIQKRLLLRRRARELVDQVGRGEVKASDDLFDEVA